jgi:hypothetical protein
MGLTVTLGEQPVIKITEKIEILSQICNMNIFYKSIAQQVGIK